MEKTEALRIIAEELKTCVIATVDGDNRPVTAVIDIMDYDENGLYFLTGRGKGLYNRLLIYSSLSISICKSFSCPCKI